MRRELPTCNKCSVFEENEDVEVKALHTAELVTGT